MGRERLVRALAEDWKAMEEREKRIGLNEALFREVNEAVSGISADFNTPSFEIICECEDLGCSERIPMTSDAYSALRTNAKQFAVLPGHELRDVEEVVADEGTYYVIEKNTPAARELAERTDPTDPTD
jgi:hypothetical protein